jgi:hypothetical protein
MNEYLLESADGGSVGACAPNPCGTPEGNQELALEFFRAVCERGERVWGRAVFAAKCSVMTRFPTNDRYYGNAYLYTLFGDPALRLKYRAQTGVEEEPGDGGMKVEPGLPSILRAPDLARLGGRVFDMQGRDVTGERRALAPGIYFLRRGGTGPGHKVIIR